MQIWSRWTLGSGCEKGSDIKDSAVVDIRVLISHLWEIQDAKTCKYIRDENHH